MVSFTAAAALLASAAALVSAQNATHQVIVGGSSGLVFTPSQITAAVGDIVTFEFQTVNHTVTQSAFSDPCALLTNTTTNQVGFDSGFVPVSDGATEFPAWSIQVTADTPIWFYCRQTGHCLKGMVGAINAPTTGAKTFSAFQALAMSSNSTTSTTGTTTSGSGVGASASGSVTDPAATGSSSTGAAGSIKANAGLALGVVAAGAFFFL